METLSQAIDGCLSSQSEISIIVSNYNGEAFLPRCLGALKESLKRVDKSNVEFHVLLVDDSSNDNSITLMREFKLEIGEQVKILKTNNIDST
jgi:glycosyltransferase involved in cell wall biosynthesis